MTRQQQNFLLAAAARAEGAMRDVEQIRAKNASSRRCRERIIGRLRGIGTLINRALK